LHSLSHLRIKAISKWNFLCYLLRFKNKFSRWDKICFQIFSYYHLFRHQRNWSSYSSYKILFNLATSYKKKKKIRMSIFDFSFCKFSIIKHFFRIFSISIKFWKLYVPVIFSKIMISILYHIQIFLKSSILLAIKRKVTSIYNLHERGKTTIMNKLVNCFLRKVFRLIYHVIYFFSSFFKAFF